MRVVPLETHTVSVYRVDDGSTGPATSWDLNFSVALPQILQNKVGGVDLEELRRINRIITTIEAANTANRSSIMLEDADWKYLVERITANKWPFASPAFERLVDAVLKAEVFDPNEMAEKPPIRARRAPVVDSEPVAETVE
jgi:hypothetical protein